MQHRLRSACDVKGVVGGAFVDEPVDGVFEGAFEGALLDMAHLGLAPRTQLGLVDERQVDEGVVMAFIISVSHGGLAHIGIPRRLVVDAPLQREREVGGARCTKRRAQIGRQYKLRVAEGHVDRAARDRPQVRAICRRRFARPARQRWQRLDAKRRQYRWQHECGGRARAARNSVAGRRRVHVRLRNADRHHAGRRGVCGLRQRRGDAVTDEHVLLRAVVGGGRCGGGSVAPTSTQKDTLTRCIT